MCGIYNGSTYHVETENTFKRMDGSFRGDWISITSRADEIDSSETMEKQARST